MPRLASERGQRRGDSMRLEREGRAWWWRPTGLERRARPWPTRNGAAWMSRRSVSRIASGSAAKRCARTSSAGRGLSRILAASPPRMPPSVTGVPLWCGWIAPCQHLGEPKRETRLAATSGTGQGLRRQDPPHSTTPASRETPTAARSHSPAFRDEHLQAHDLDPTLSCLAEHDGDLVGFLLARRWREKSVGFVTSSAFTLTTDDVGSRPPAQDRVRPLCGGWAATGTIGVGSDNPRALTLYQRCRMTPRLRIDINERLARRWPEHGHPQRQGRRPYQNTTRRQTGARRGPRPLGRTRGTPSCSARKVFAEGP